ncbi:MAG: LysR family transcriptional regulator [Alphaproteobacteria bacterium]|nr:LysR family transcriptional regulator [Alphaproteobacteria bacterium]
MKPPDDAPTFPPDRSRRLQARLRVQHLMMLVSLGRHRNAHRTASDLGLSQPAVSKMVREIEEMFGARLFDRGRGGMHPNGVGEALIARAAALLNDIERTSDDMEALAAGEAGHLRLGVIAFVTPALVARTLRRLAGERVSPTVEIREGTTQPLVDQLLRREIDCVIGRYATEREAELDQTIFYRQRFAVVVGRRHPRLGRGRRVTLADAASADWVVTPPRTAARQAMSALFMGSGLPSPRVRIETASMEIMKSALVDNELVGLLPADIARHYERAGQLRILPFRPDVQPAPLTLIRRRGERPLPSVERFCEALLVTAAGLDDGEAQPPASRAAPSPAKRPNTTADSNPLPER